MNNLGRLGQQPHKALYHAAVHPLSALPSGGTGGRQKPAKKTGILPLPHDVYRVAKLRCASGVPYALRKAPGGPAGVKKRVLPAGTVAPWIMRQWRQRLAADQEPERSEQEQTPAADEDDFSADL
jgi:hypothetical protein